MGGNSSKQKSTRQTSLEVFSLESHAPCTVNEHLNVSSCPKCIRCMKFQEWENKKCYTPDSLVSNCPIVWATPFKNRDFLKWVRYARKIIRKQEVLKHLRG